MKLKKGKGTTKYGKGINIELSGSEVATAIYAYLVSHNVHVSGARTITMRGELLSEANIYVDPSASVIANNKLISCRTGKLIKTE